MILFRPQETVDRLLAKPKFGQSWGATWFLVGINLLMVFLIGIWFSAEFMDVMELTDSTGEPLMEATATTALLLFWGIFAVISGLTVLISTILSRFFFKWLVILGIRIVASKEYPTDPAERREKGRLVELIQPYTMWIYMVSMVITTPFLPLFFDLNSMIEILEINEMGGMDDRTGADLARLLFGFFIWGAITQLISLGLYIYMIIVRVIALRKIYNISIAKAFFGPFLTYFIVYVIGMALYLMFVFTITLFGASGAGLPVV